MNYTFNSTGWNTKKYTLWFLAFLLLIIFENGSQNLCTCHMKCLKWFPKHIFGQKFDENQKYQKVDENPETHISWIFSKSI